MWSPGSSQSPELQLRNSSSSLNSKPWCTVVGHFAHMKTDAERRSGTRIATRVPTRVRSVHGADQTAQTRDVSANGIFLYTESRMEKGTDVELVLILPPELTSGEKCWVCCQATIVRVEEQGSQFGVAAQIRHMDILPEAIV
jgi:hypothetical protein